MTDSREDIASEHFDSGVTDRERAVFEGGITLGALYHQFAGAPVKDEDSLEESMEQAAVAHPYVEEAEVRVNTPAKEGKSPFDYGALSGEDLEIRLVARYGGARAELEMRWIPEMGYPLMFVKEIGRKD